MAGSGSRWPEEFLSKVAPLCTSRPTFSYLNVTRTMG
jgi:hypothetical protein